MKNRYYRIGEVSQITGVSKDTLHFYSKTGLLRPDHIDPSNGYGHYSRWNLWQLDIITTCRKLGVPLGKVREILASGDNEKVTELLMDYRREALRLSDYYRQVAEDIRWYGEENQHILQNREQQGIRKIWLEEETVIAGSMKRDEISYHANLQETVKEELRQSASIRKKYGYILDPEALKRGEVVKRREYLKLDRQEYETIPEENLYVLPAGRYAVFTLHIREERADFAPLLQWLQGNGESADQIFAEELGLQLFNYIHDYYCEIRAHLKEKKDLTV